MDVNDVHAKRSGRMTTELLCMNSLYRALDPLGCPHDACYMESPTPLDEGKTARDQFAVCKRSWKTLRELGHQGPAIQQYLMDRAGMEALCNIFYAWHSLLSKGDSMPVDDLHPQNILDLTEFFVRRACALHDAQKAIQWSHPLFADKEFMKNCHIVIESIRNSMCLGLLHSMS